MLACSVNDAVISPQCRSARSAVRCTHMTVQVSCASAAAQAHLACRNRGAASWAAAASRGAASRGAGAAPCRGAGPAAAPACRWLRGLHSMQPGSCSCWVASSSQYRHWRATDSNFYSNIRTSGMAAHMIRQGLERRDCLRRGPLHSRSMQPVVSAPGGGSSGGGSSGGSGGGPSGGGSTVSGPPAAQQQQLSSAWRHARAQPASLLTVPRLSPTIPYQFLRHSVCWPS